MSTHTEIFDRYNIVPKKSLGQNFLVQDGILEKIARATSLVGEYIIEVGPGYGALTQHILAAHPATLVLVEYDLLMIDILCDRLKKGDFGWATALDDTMREWQVGPTRLTLHKGDILEYTPTTRVKIIANIPYYITSPILFRFLYDVEYSPTEMIVLMQQEVGNKIRCARGEKASYLSTALGRACTSITEIMKVGAANFIPPPRVESSVLHFVSTRGRDCMEDAEFLRVLGAGYLHPRKLLASNLAEGLNTDKSKILTVLWELWHSATIRAGELDQEEWMQLVSKMSKIIES